jgi:tRNA dimethylallyltransferase
MKVVCDIRYEGPLVFVMGPTGVGKSNFAARLAGFFPLEVINVDSTSVYKDLNIGSGKPNKKILAATHHHLLSFCELGDTYSAARFRADALKSVSEIRTRGKVPVLVGGTGMYFRMFEKGMALLPEANTEIRLNLQRLLKKNGVEYLHSILIKLDPLSADRINPNDSQRIIRAIEVCRVSDTRMSLLMQSTHESLSIPPVKFVLTFRERSAIHEKVSLRFHSMLEQGLINEVSQLRRTYHMFRNYQALNSVGYKQVGEFLDNEITYKQMIEKAIIATRQLAKRQLTWLNREDRSIWYEWSEPDKNVESVLECLTKRGVVG